MINLMPPDTKKSYYYARANQKLLKWLAVLALGIIGLGIIGTYGWVGLHQSLKTNQQQVAQTEAELTRQNLTGTEEQVQTISSDFSLVVKVLSQEVLFSKLLTKMAAAMPNGANLTELNITNTSSGSGMDITADATDYTTATQVDANLSDPSNGIFAKTDIVNISCSTKNNNGFNTNYPCTVVLRAQFAQNNQFLFINQGAK